MPPQPPEPGTPIDDPTPLTKLYVNEKADSARNQAIGILGFVALILSIGTALGVLANARAYVNQRVKDLHLDELRQRADTAVAAAEADAAKIAQLRQQLETGDRLTALESKLNDKFDRTTVLKIQNAGSGLFLEIPDPNKTKEESPLIQRGNGDLRGQEWHLLPAKP